MSIKSTITADDMDKIAFAWIEERKPESFFGSPVGKEFGFPECEYK